MPPGEAAVRSGAGLRLPLSLNRRDHRSDTDDIEGSSEIVDERGETELAADIVEAPHQESGKRSLSRTVEIGA